MEIMEALAIITGYLLGSIPFAYIAGRLIKGVDIREVGGGNVGTLNVMREIGVAAGWGVFAADIAKGALAVLVAWWLDLSMIFVFIAGFAAVVGHSWPIFLKFKGGMGTATAMGVLLAMAPIEVAISFAILLIVVLFTSNVRLGLGVGLIALPLIIWGFGGTGSLIAYSLALLLFIALRSIPALKKSFTGSKRDLIIDSKYKPWQRKKS